MLGTDESILLSNLPGAVLAVEDDGRIAFASAAARRLLGWEEPLEGVPMSALVPPDLRDRYRAVVEERTRAGAAPPAGSAVRVPALRRDGSERELDITLQVLRRRDGSPLVTASLKEAAPGPAPAGLAVLEDPFQRRLRQLI